MLWRKNGGKNIDFYPLHLRVSYTIKSDIRVKAPCLKKIGNDKGLFGLSFLPDYEIQYQNDATIIIHW